MIKVKIYGAGSIGNHLCNACRSKGWEVTICDKDSKALERMKNDIYPSRYGGWDESIRLITSEEDDTYKYDLVIIGTPPDTHAAIAINVLNTAPPKLMLVEKPMLTPDIKGANELYELAKSKGTHVVVGYNHTLTINTKRAEQLLKENIVGAPLTITSMTREHWGGIFKAHPWLNGPEDTYLGYYSRGGGACCEHSHAINIWQHFSRFLQLGKITKVTAVMDIKKEGKAEYDSVCLISVETEKGFIGDIVLDVITAPTKKNVRIQGKDGFLEWHVGYKNNIDAVIYGNANESQEVLIEKTRPDDFKGEISHLEELLKSGEIETSPISIERGLDTMLVIAAAFISHKEKRQVKIDYSKGYTLNAIN